MGTIKTKKKGTKMTAENWGVTLTPAIEVERTWDSMPKQDPIGIQWGSYNFSSRGAQFSIIKL